MSPGLQRDPMTACGEHCTCGTEEGRWRIIFPQALESSEQGGAGKPTLSHLQHHRGNLKWVQMGRT